MLPSCREVCRRIASDELTEAEPWERLMIRFHVWRCRDCSLYVEQLRTIGKWARRRAHEDEPPASTLERLERSILDASAVESRERAGHAED